MWPDAPEDSQPRFDKHKQAPEAPIDLGPLALRRKAQEPFMSLSLQNAEHHAERIDMGRSSSIMSMPPGAKRRAIFRLSASVT